MPELALAARVPDGDRADGGVSARAVRDLQAPALDLTRAARRRRRENSLGGVVSGRRLPSTLGHPRTGSPHRAPRPQSRHRGGECPGGRCSAACTRRSSRCVARRPWPTRSTQTGRRPRPGRALERAQKWETLRPRVAGAPQGTAKSLGLLIRRYNALARNATAEQRRLLVTLVAGAPARRDGAPRHRPAVTYETTQSAAALAARAGATRAPGRDRGTGAPSEPTTKTS